MSSVLTADNLELTINEAEPTPEEAAVIQSAMRDMYKQIKDSNARMEANRIEIDRLKAETRVILDSISGMLSR